MNKSHEGYGMVIALTRDLGNREYIGKERSLVRMDDAGQGQSLKFLAKCRETALLSPEMRLWLELGAKT
jgi:hypothetical protein